MRSITELITLKNRVAVVTGGTSPIGSVFCETLAELGAAIAVSDLNEKACAKQAKKLAQIYSVEALALPLDLSRPKDIQKVSDTVLKKFERLDILVNCAALTSRHDMEGWTGPFEQQTLESWNKALSLNLTAAFLLTKNCKQALSRSGRGAIINMGSIYGMVGPTLKLYEGTSMGNPAAYAASKGGLLQLTRWLAAVLAPEIRVNAISPGGVFRGHRDPFLSRYQDITPLKRMATEEDLKGGLAYLASDLSRYVTGHNLVIDGGWTIR